MPNRELGYHKGRRLAGGDRNRAKDAANKNPVQGGEKSSQELILEQLRLKQYAEARKWGRGRTEEDVL